MVTLIIMLCCLLAFAILCFDLLEIAIRRLLLVSILIVAAILLAPLYFVYGMYTATLKDPAVVADRRKQLAKNYAKFDRIIVNFWTIPVKTAMLEPHIKKAVKTGLRDGFAMRQWFKRSQLNPKHPFTVWDPGKSFVKGNAYLMYKEYARATRTPVKPPKDFTLFDILP